VDPLQAEFGWSPAVLAAATSLTLLVSGCASPLVGRLVDRYQPRRIILVGSVATAAGYLLLARIDQLWQLFVLLGWLAFFRTWIFYIPFTTLVTRWFSRRRATAMGIATSGFGIGGLVFLPLTAEVLSSLGWRAAFVMAALLVAVINGVFLLFVRNEPPARWADYDTAPSGSASGRAAAEGLWAFPDVRSIVRAPVFWLLAAGFALFFCAQWAFLFHGPQVLEHAGLTPRNAALVFSLSAGLGVFLRLSSGWMLDQVHRFEVLAAAVLAVMALALFTLGAGTSAPLLGAFVLLWGIGSGIGPALEPILVSRLFGRKHYGTVYGILDGADTLVSIPGPYLGGLLFDLTGTYGPVLGLYGGAFLVGAGAFAVIARLAGGRLRLPVPSVVRQQSPALP
jgi:sugar phosphate permease